MNDVLEPVGQPIAQGTMNQSSHDSSDTNGIYRSREKGIKTRRVIEMVGALHRLGYGRLRLACSWEDGPAPWWCGTIAPGGCFREDHRAILAQDSAEANRESLRKHVGPTALPMFKNRHFIGLERPWPGFLDATLDEVANKWMAIYPQVALAGLGLDSDDVAWYKRMLDATAPTARLRSNDGHGLPRPRAAALTDDVLSYKLPYSQAGIHAIIGM